MKKVYEIKLQLYESAVLPTDIQYVATDRGTMPLCIKLMCRNTPFEIPGEAIAELNFQLQNDMRYVRTAEIENCTEGNIIYHMTMEDISTPGEITASVTLIVGTKRLTWQGFRFKVVQGLREQ